MPNEQEALRSLLIFRQFGSSRDFSNRLGIASEYELEDIKEQAHEVLRLFQGAIVTPWFGFFLCFQKLTKKCCRIHRI